MNTLKTLLLHMFLEIRSINKLTWSFKENRYFETCCSPAITIRVSPETHALWIET